MGLVSRYRPIMLFWIATAIKYIMPRKSKVMPLIIPGIAILLLKTVKL
jgi:hypothetical protein